VVKLMIVLPDLQSVNFSKIRCRDNFVTRLGRVFSGTLQMSSSGEINSHDGFDAADHQVRYAAQIEVM
jgi:hypothetical protein